MKTADFFFNLPENLIAQFPHGARGESRLMALDRSTGTRKHLMVSDLPEILTSPSFLSPEGEKPLMVFNDTKVRKTRLFGKSTESGKDEEFLLLEPHRPNVSSLSAQNPRSQIWKAITKHAKRKKKGNSYIFYGIKAAIKSADAGFILLEFERELDEGWFEKNGHVPLPPYIKRKDTPADSDRYQSVYAKYPGSSAAPTAGLHFTEELLEKLSAKGIGRAFVTLHVGLGTFLPVRSENIEDHTMHEEHFEISQDNASIIENAYLKKRKVIAVGTTSLRSLESAFSGGKIKRGAGSTSIFIYPGYKFRAADALFTNFHTPLSTLLMLVCAFAGKDLIMESYADAIEKEYRFFSYGDAMLIF